MRTPIAIALRLIAATIAVASIAAVAYHPDKAIRTATGVTAMTLCSDVFVSRLDPAIVFAQAITTRPGGLGRLARHMHYRVDHDSRQFSVDYRGHFANRAVYRDGLGCLLLQGPAPSTPACLRNPRGPYHCCRRSPVRRSSCRPTHA